MAMWYRYVDGRHAPPLNEWDEPAGKGSAYIHCYEYRVLKYTPKGAWIDNYGTRRFVLASARKRYAHATKDDALVAFKERKRRQLWILKNQVAHVEEIILLVGVGAHG